MKVIEKVNRELEQLTHGTKHEYELIKKSKQRKSSGASSKNTSTSAYSNQSQSNKTEALSSA